MSVILQSSGGGQITIQEPATASNFTQTLPAATGTVMVSGNQPAFSAYQSSSQTLSSATLTKIQFQTEEFDTASAFDNATNYRFTPLVAGYYQISASVNASTTTNIMLTTIYKNGTRYKDGTFVSGTISSVSSLVYLNGSTDYVEIYGYLTVGQGLSATINGTWFNGAMIRAA